jgi:bifunctional non-homologous end joining protein LigD
MILILAILDVQRTESVRARRGRGNASRQVSKDDKVSRKTSPLAVIPKDPGLRQTHWIEPKMIAEVAFMEWTSDGSIRHPSFQGLREDKNPKEVVREQPAAGQGKTKTRSKRSG